jgi:hypothetical protein
MASQNTSRNFRLVAGMTFVSIGLAGTSGSMAAVVSPACLLSSPAARGVLGLFWDLLPAACQAIQAFADASHGSPCGAVSLLSISWHLLRMAGGAA